MSDTEHPDEGPAVGLLASLQRLFATLLEVVQTRVEIISTEFEEERERIRELMVLGVVALSLVSLGLVLLTLFIVVMFWDSYRLHVLGGFALLYLGLGFVAANVLRRRLKSRPRLFATTVEELSKDRDRLTPR